MRTLVAASVVAYATADETSLMQDMVKRSVSTKLDVSSTRQDSTSKLLDTAVNMIKNGVTPDVITFVDATNQDINDEVLVAIQSEHDIDQAYINDLCSDFQAALDRLTVKAGEVANHDSNREAARQVHHECRADEAYKCARSRRCEEQLRQRWESVKREETRMREIHGHIHEEWCIHPPYVGEPEGAWPPIEDWLSHQMNWAQTSPYPLLQIPADVKDFRTISVDYFHSYMEQKVVVETAWQVYNEKLAECAVLEEEWEMTSPLCDDKQRELREHACSHATLNRQTRAEFAQEWERIMGLFEQARETKTANEQARKNEWETLKIVQCLLDHVHSSVITSIETGAPCPTVDSDPEGVTLAIEDCHIVTRGCGPESLTAHLCLDWCDEPPVPPLPPVEAPACTPMYIALEQAQFLEAIQTSYTLRLESNADYPSDSLLDYETILSPAGWAGCAPPLVCEDCEGLETESPCVEHVGGAHTCLLHEEYLSPGEGNFDTFRCLDGTCIPQAGRCNGYSNCDDGSDETGCHHQEGVHFVPAYMAQSSTCPDDFHPDVHFRCDNGCIEKVGLCNGVPNCNDGSDEAHCAGSVQVTVEATSGRQVTVESAQMSTGVFHDRSYNFDDLGHFSGKTFIKYSNDDKMTSTDHVMMKIRAEEPVTVFIVKLDESRELPWISRELWNERRFSTGVSFSGVRSTRHKEWDSSLLTTDSFAATSVYSKVFPAGTISIPGNSGGDGSFLIFLDKPSTQDEYDSRLTAYWESGDCGVHNNDWNWGWCGNTAGECPVTIATDLCASGEAELAEYHGTGEQNSWSRDGCNYFWHAQYRCTPVPPQIGGEAQFIGCFVDDGSRDLGEMVGNRDNADTNTFVKCRERCGDSEYMSLQFGGECFCAASIGNGAQYAEVDASECNVQYEPCSSHSYNCGGVWRNAIYRINHIVQWDVIAHQDFHSGLFPSSAKTSLLMNEHDPYAPLFMNIGNLNPADYLVDGSYHFRLVYTDVGDAFPRCHRDTPLQGPNGQSQEAEWKQTSWITTVDSVTGFEVISPADLSYTAYTSNNAGCEFSGLSVSSSGSAIIDASPGNSWWFGSVGTIAEFTSEGYTGMPALNGGAAESMTLYALRAR